MTLSHPALVTAADKDAVVADILARMPLGEVAARHGMTEGMVRSAGIPPGYNSATDANCSRRRGRYDDLDGYRQWLATQGLDPRQVDEYVVKTRSLIAHGVTTEEALQSAYKSHSVKTRRNYRWLLGLINRFESRAKEVPAGEVECR